MPASAKRSQKTRRESRREASPSRAPESSPSRPAKRRKKESAPDPTEDDEALVTADHPGLAGTDNDRLISQVTQHLLVPPGAPVQASKDHSNAIHESNKDGVKAYAKISAQDWTYYVTKPSVNIGRSSEPNPTADDEDDEDYVHIDLGPSKTVSRQHALIYFDSKEEKWYLQVRGRNGAKLDADPLKIGNLRALVSGQVVEIGGVEMMFVLPSEITPLHIHSIYLQRAGLSGLDAPSSSQTAPTPVGSSGQAPPRVAGNAKLPQPIAPAPPDYKRPGTPPSARRRSALTANRTPQHTNPLLMSNSDLDLSLDDNSHVKPQYSYAQMITQAILSTPDEKLSLGGIYSFITTNYSYYRHQPPGGWQNSIRHNLSLNKSFDKVARSTDEPGKGMKWQLVPEGREEMIRSAYKGGRGGHRGSSAPSSPSQLNYITQGPKEMAAKDPLSVRKRKTSPTGSPPPSSALREAQSTPDRARTGAHAQDIDDSPLPRSRRGGKASSSFPSTNAPQSPVLTSSFLQDEGGSFVTPAPHRVHPKLAPPSTAQRPSQHMPTSSPAPFWKYVDIGSTPLKPTAHFDLSPTKNKDGLAQSSSPPQGTIKSPASSLSKTRILETKDDAGVVEEEEEEGFDLTKGFQSIASYHAPVPGGLSVAGSLNGHR